MPNWESPHQVRRNREVERPRIRRKYNILDVSFPCRQGMPAASSFLTEGHCSCHNFSKGRAPGIPPPKKIRRRTCEKQLETLMVRMVKLAKTYHTCFHVLCQTPKNLQEIGHFLALMLVILLVP